MLNATLDQISDGRCSSVVSTLNLSWNDISDRQQSFYLQKLEDIITSALSVLVPGQEDQVWKAFE